MGKILKLEPFTKGMQNAYAYTSAPADTLADAVNVDIDIQGNIYSRSGYALKSLDAHSLFEHNNITYAVHQNNICQITSQNITPVSNLTINDKLSWTVINDEPVFTGPTTLGKISSNTVIPLGIPKPVVTPNAMVGQQAFAYSYINALGEEGPLSALTLDPITYIPQGYSLNTYSTVSELIEGTVITSDALHLEVGGSLGHTPVTMGCDSMPGGNHISYWRGRLLIARGRTLFVSKALYYSIYEEDAGVYHFENQITFIASVENGIFIGVRDTGVYFLQGTSPEAWQKVLASNEVAHEGAAIVVPGTRVSIGNANTSKDVAIWFTSYGFAVGMPTGEVSFPQRENLQNLEVSSGSLWYSNGRITVLYD